VICMTADEYVMCNGCKSPDTILSKENRLFFLRCEQVFVKSNPFHAIGGTHTIACVTGVVLVMLCM
jgi:translation initiation factor 2 beta subunit (eIF-2beta)/eIF-5